MGRFRLVLGKQSYKFKQQTGGGDERDPVTLLPIQGRKGEVQLRKSQETKTPAKVTLLREVTFLP